jgi:hypothetical protein
MQRPATSAIAMVSAISMIVTVHANGSATHAIDESLPLRRFLTADDAPLVGYRAFRRLEASNAKFGKDAWLEVWTEADETGFRYEIVKQGGSDYVCNKVLKKALERERAIWNGRLAARSNLTQENYEFLAASTEPSGLVRVKVKPKRQDELLIDGSIVLNAESGDLLRVEGRLAKSPSFWAGRVEVVREYVRIEGIRVPVRTESLAQVKMAGASSFTMTYHYEMINGRYIGQAAEARRDTQSANNLGL